MWITMPLNLVLAHCASCAAGDVEGLTVTGLNHKVAPVKMVHHSPTPTSPPPKINK